jgi:transposase
MYVKRHQVRRGDKVYTYYRLCRTERRDGQPYPVVVANLGALSDDEAARLIDSLQRAVGLPAVALDDAAAGPWRQFGGPLLVERLLALADLPRLCGHWRHRRHAQDIARTVQVLLTAQLLEPGSDLNTHRFQERLAGERIPYHHFLRALDVVAAQAEELQQGLLQRVQTLFDQELDLVFYDLTSSYFEGDGPADLAKRGYSRDHRGDCVQCVLGLVVTREGFPVAWEVHEGNTVDCKTLPGLVEKLTQRFRIGRCVVVADSGLLSRENIASLDQAGLPYVLGMRAKSSAVGQQLMAATRDREPDGEVDNGVRFWHLPADQGLRHVVLWSQGREKKTRRILERKQREAGPKLDQLRRDVAAGKVKSTATMERRASKIVTAAQVGKYVSWEAAPGAFTWQWREDVVEAAEVDAGKYVLQTNVAELTAQQIVETYHQLATVEEAFRMLKSTLRLRPIFHRKRSRVTGHIGVCVLALFLLNVLRQALRQAKLEVSVSEAIRACREVLAVPVEVVGREVWPTPHVPELARAVFAAVGISDVRAEFRSRHSDG